MTWNRSLWNKVGDVIGSEAVRQRNADGNIVPGLTYFTPNINIFRDPRWGRGQETPGEDPFLTSHYAAVMVMALQFGSHFYEDLQRAANDYKPDAIKPRIAATCKHFAAYSLETNRFNFSANIDQRDWEDTYMVAFDACIHAEKFLCNHFGKTLDSANSASALGVMCSYNAINGTPSCANSDLLSKTLREEWNFTGYIVSDCWAIANVYEHHNFAKSYQEAVGMSLRAGVDLDCGDTVQKYGLSALSSNFLTVEDIDRALSRLFGVLIDLGYFDETVTQQNLENDNVTIHSNDQVALEAALQSVVLLKNGPDSEASSRPLPLSIARHKRITVVGPFADNKEAMLGNYHGIPTRVITPLEGLRGLGAQVNHIQGCNVTGNSHHMVHGSTEQVICDQLNANNDATVIFVGLDQTIESEELDRKTLLLPIIQQDLIEHTMRCSKSISPNAPFILVVVTGGPLDISRYKTSHFIDAIIYTSYLGQAGGTALAQVLYGEYNPSGRLVTTIYPESYLDKVQLQDMRMRPDQSDEYPERTYRFYNDKGAIYPFGYGLSYSTWQYSLYVDVAREVIVSVNVSNTGHMDGSISVLLFHKGPQSGVMENPIKSLIGFEKVFVTAQGFQMVRFRCRQNIFDEKGEHAFEVGPSLDDDFVLRINV